MHFEDGVGGDIRWLFYPTPSPLASSASNPQLLLGHAQGLALGKSLYLLFFFFFSPEKQSNRASSPNTHPLLVQKTCLPGPVTLPFTPRMTIMCSAARQHEWTSPGDATTQFTSLTPSWGTDGAPRLALGTSWAQRAHCFHQGWACDELCWDGQNENSGFQRPLFFPPHGEGRLLLHPLLPSKFLNCTIILKLPLRLSDG